MQIPVTEVPLYYLLFANRITLIVMTTLQEYFSLFAAAGYDMPTISRMWVRIKTTVSQRYPLNIIFFHEKRHRNTITTTLSIRYIIIFPEEHLRFKITTSALVTSWPTYSECDSFSIESTTLHYKEQPFFCPLLKMQCNDGFCKWRAPSGNGCC